MEDQFEGLEIEFKDLNPAIQEKALQFAKKLINEGSQREEAVREAIRLAEERFLDLEG